MEEIQQYIKDTHSDPFRNDPLGNCPRIEPVSELTAPLNVMEPTLKEITEVVNKARTGSALGPNGSPYKVYNMCSKLLRRLCNLLKVIWRNGKVPECWQQAAEIFTPKVMGSKRVIEFRTISLLNVEGKLFFAVLPRRMATFLTANRYIDTSVQKGVPGFSGCLEHTSAISQIIRETKVNNKDLTVIWQDLAYAYGSIPHKLIDEAMKHYVLHPRTYTEIINDYFDRLQLRFSVGGQTTP